MPSNVKPVHTLFPMDVLFVRTFSVARDSIFCRAIPRVIPCVSHATRMEETNRCSCGRLVAASAISNVWMGSGGTARHVSRVLLWCVVLDFIRAAMKLIH